MTYYPFETMKPFAHVQLPARCLVPFAVTKVPTPKRKLMPSLGENFHFEISLEALPTLIRRVIANQLP